MLSNSKKIMSIAAALSILLVGCTGIEVVNEEILTEDISNSQVHLMEESETKKLIETLSAMSGRVPGSENNEKATAMIAERFLELGLKPLLKEDYLWPYEQSINGNIYFPNNVVGYMEGVDNETAIVISCHFDAVAGSHGSVDNASGTAAMLRVAANMLSEETKPKVDIIFCAFNGEEQDYSGSKDFVKQLGEHYRQLSNINFDCVGMISGGAYMFGAESSEVGYALNQAVRSYLDDYDIPYGEYLISKIRSDHLSFNTQEIPNINFTQSGILSVTHSENDTPDKLDVDAIDNLADCITDYLIANFFVG